MYKTVKILSVIATAAVLAAGCDKNEPLTDAAAGGSTVSFSQPQTGDIDLYGKTESVSVSFQVLKEGTSPCNVSVACMTQAQLNEYEPFYAAITEDCYTIDNSGLAFAADETSKEIKVTFTAENMSRIMDLALSSGGKQPALALALESEDADVDGQMGVVYWSVSLSGDKPVVSLKGETEGESVFYVTKEAALSFAVSRIGDGSECQVNIVPVSQEDMSAYNPDYVAIPQDCFTCPENVVFYSGEYDKEIPVTFSDENLGKIIELQNTNSGKQTVLAFSLESDNAEISSGMNTVYWKINAREIPFKLESISGIDNSMNALLDAGDLDKGNLQNLPVLTFAVSPDYEEEPVLETVYRADLATQYNSENGTSYSVLPEGVIDFETAVDNDKVTVSFKTVGEIPDVTAHYLVPVEVKNSDFPINFTEVQNAGIIDGVYYVVLSSVVPLTVDDLWSPCSDETEGNLYHLVDNSVVPESFWSSTWHTQYMNDVWHHFVQADFEQPLETAFRVNFWKRNYDPVRPTKAEFWVTTDEEVSEDQSRWVLLDTVTDNEEGGLPGATGVFTPWESEAYVFSNYPELAGKQVRHFRFVFVTVQNGGTCGVDATASCAIGELKFWGK